MRHLGVLLACCSGAVGGDINVNTASSAIAVDGRCSLSEAIENANKNARTHADCAAGSGIFDVINLAAPGPYEFSVAHHVSARGATALPTIISGGNGSPSVIVINGNGNILRRSPTLFNEACEPCSGNGAKFRLIEVDTTGRLTLQNLSLRNGCAAAGGLGSDGGAILNHGTLDLNRVTIANNAAAGGGGAVATYTASLTANNTSLVNNQGSEGGALWSLGSTTALTSSTIGLNRASSQGGGVYGRLGNSFSTKASNSTFSSNFAPAGGADIAGAMTVQGTILASMGACSNALTSSGYNVATDSTCALAGQRDLVTAAPGIGAYTSAGGPGQGVFPLLPGSPAVDLALSCPSTDQLGRARFGACDAGAVEYRPGESIGGTCDSLDQCSRSCVARPNQAPVATPQTVYTRIGSPVSIALNGFDGDGDPISFTITQPPSNGTVSGSPPAVLFTPVAGFAGSTQFSFSVSDGRLVSPPAVVVVVVDATPPIITAREIGTLIHGFFTPGARVEFDIIDPESGVVASCPTVELSSSGPATCTAVNRVGLAATKTVFVKVDRSPPLLQRRLYSAAGVEIGAGGLSHCTDGGHAYVLEASRLRKVSVEDGTPLGEVALGQGVRCIFTGAHVFVMLPQSVVRVRAADLQVDLTVQLGSPVGGIAYDGAVLVALPALGQLARIDPLTGGVQQRIGIAASGEVLSVRGWTFVATASGLTRLAADGARLEIALGARPYRLVSDGRWIIAAHSEGVSRVNVDDGVVAAFSGPSARALGTDGALLYAASDAAIRVLDLADGRLVRTIQASGVNSLTFDVFGGLSLLTPTALSRLY